MARNTEAIRNWCIFQVLFLQRAGNIVPIYRNRRYRVAAGDLTDLMDGSRLVSTGAQLALSALW
jgi:hypothetical protein